MKCALGSFFIAMVSGCINLFGNLENYLQSYFWFSKGQYTDLDDYYFMTYSVSFFIIGMLIGAVLFNHWQINL